MLNSLLVYLKGWRNLSSLIDQVLVSGGNFLAIAICAHSLSLAEQGKYTYIFASYIALLLLNVAGIFQGAAVRAPSQDQYRYITMLARLQMLQALVLSILVSAGWLLTGEAFGWKASVAEIGLLFAFLLLQQLADFDRRSAYIFAGSKRALFSSTIIYPARIFGLLVIQPDTISEALMIMVITAIIPAFLAVRIALRDEHQSVHAWIIAAREHIVYSRLFIAGIPLVWLWAYIPVFMLGVMYGKEQVAILGSIRGISNMANVLMEQIETKVAADWGRIHHGIGAPVLEAAALRLIKLGVLFWMLNMAILLVFGKEIVYLVLGNLYVPHWHMLLIGWIGYGLYFIARIYGIKHRTLGSNQIEFIGNIAAVITAVVAGMAMVTDFGATGAAWVYVEIALVILLSQAYFIKRLERR